MGQNEEEGEGNLGTFDLIQVEILILMPDSN